MSLIVYLFFNGNCEEAMNFYTQATGGSIVNIGRYGDNDMPCSDTERGKVMHGVALIHGSQVMFSDSGDNRKMVFGDNFSISLDYKNPAEMQQAFDALAAGGEITMPLQDTFWGATFGMLTDKFGVNWMFNYDKPQA